MCRRNYWRAACAGLVVCVSALTASADLQPIQIQFEYQTGAGSGCEALENCGTITVEMAGEAPEVAFGCATGGGGIALLTINPAPTDDLQGDVTFENSHGSASVTHFNFNGSNLDCAIFAVVSHYRMLADDPCASASLDTTITLTPGECVEDAGTAVSVNVKNIIPVSTTVEIDTTLGMTQDDVENSTGDVDFVELDGLMNELGVQIDDGVAAVDEMTAGGALVDTLKLSAFGNIELGSGNPVWTFSLGGWGGQSYPVTLDMTANGMGTMIAAFRFICKVVLTVVFVYKLREVVSKGVA